MRTHHLLTFFYVFLFLSIFWELCLSNHDTITQSQSITDGKSLVSSGQTFELGFFSPGKSDKRYLGIWYKATPKAVVWVANRNNPLTDSYGELVISENENYQLVLLNRSRGVVWSSNSSSRFRLRNPVAQLLDSGNLVLRESESMSSELYLWQSFDYPTDTISEGMKLGWDLNSGLDRILTSWKSDEDPSTGAYTYRLSDTGLPQLVLSTGSTVEFRTGAWNGVRFSGLDVLPSNDDSGLKNKLFFSENVSYYMFERGLNSEFISRLTLNQSGSIQLFILEMNKSSTSTEWEIIFSSPSDPCDRYGHCGANGICRINGNPICDCLVGFTSRPRNGLNVFDLSKGCERKTALNCEKGDGFVKLEDLKLPDLLGFQLNKSMNLEECREACLKDCSCTAYANSDMTRQGSGCLMWFGDMIDIREYSVKGNKQDLYLRLSANDIESLHASKKTKNVILTASTLSGISIFGLLLWCLCWSLRAKTKGKEMDLEGIELPLFDFSAISVATNNFSTSNMIGEGGFGPVYKGNLATGQEAAIKRLAKDSRQGFKEFKTEVDLIAKLRHKNLVALLGCCIRGDERLLIYEYLQNKSLDNFIFGHKRITTLLWQKTFDIVTGIARGLLYLHHDSNLHIVHRDLKASNILLDTNMIPKIADFGLARLIGGDENETRTQRVVGTYGYMSPEYAINGRVSLKSDVFSFGVVLLEIVSGERNTKFSHPNHHHNLLGHAWLLWNEGKALQLMENACFNKDSLVESQFLRCINVALLCVQNCSEDRPTMNSVVRMFSYEGAKLPQPKEPGFFTERSFNNASASRDEECNASDNLVTITELDGR